jgi:hypothetical protein
MWIRRIRNTGSKGGGKLNPILLLCSGQRIVGCTGSVPRLGHCLSLLQEASASQGEDKLMRYQKKPLTLPY